ncbi:CHAT domain-containing protein [Pleurocapsa sp. PCC 7319]|uniref:CHAT domain-containing protein n=1 Tax=Pleurocapsa sp. PCC 7319 TaxID=118161 RepID=UPI00034B1082|nr:CHAT domain-containing protein [Pleurocapsa sp. PCC 7319]
MCITIPLFIPKTIGAEVSSTSSQSNILLDRADNAYASGNYQEAISIWLKVVKEQKPKSNQLATVYANLASIYWHTGKAGEAVKYWQESLKIYREIKTNKFDEKIAATLVDTARAYNDLGQPRFSIPLLTEAISIAKNKELNRVENMGYLTLGNAYTIQGDYSPAINAYKNSLKGIDRVDNDLPIVVWNNLSKGYQQQALITRQKAIAAETEEDLSADKLWQQVKSDRASAWQAAKKATEIRVNSKSMERVEALLQRAKIAQDDADKSSDVVDSLLKAEVILSALPDSHHKVYALIELSELTNNYDLRSKKILDSTVKTAQKIDNPKVSSSAYGAMGKYYESQQQYDKALYWTEQAQFTAQQIQALDSLYQWDWQTARIYNATGKTEAAIEAYERAIASLQSIRANTTRSQGNPLSEFQSDLEPIYRGFMQLLLSNNSDERNLELALQTKDLLLLSELEAFFEDDCFELETYSETDRLAYLKKTNTAVINTVIIDNKTYMVWQLPNGQFKKYALDITQQELQRLVNQWRFDLENKENDNYLALSQRLYDLLFTPEIKSYLETSELKNLIFVNDGILRNVPMAALHDGEKFLVEDYTIANSLGLNIQIKQPQPKIEKALAFGLTVGVNNFPTLPYVKQEIEQLGKLADEKGFLNEEFTKSSFKQQIESNKSSLVHIATHGRFGGNRENTFLQAYRSQIDLQELEEILSTHSLNFPSYPIQLLVLSACDTAAGDPQSTLGMSGVASRSGIKNVLGSLWSVNDRQIVTLIDAFYDNWIEDRLPLPDALRQAQLDLISSPDYHPSNWSSMILFQK